MFENIKSVLTSWNASTNERQKLQHAYLAITVTVVLVAGLVSLVNANTGHDMVNIGRVAIAAFLANAIVWNLLQSGLLAKLPRQKPTRRK